MNTHTSSERLPRPKLKTILLEIGETQRSLSLRAGIPESYVSAYIHGKYNLSSIEKAKIAQALNRQINEVFSG